MSFTEEFLKAPLSEQKKEQLSKVLDKQHLGPSKDSCNSDEGREIELSSSPRAPTKWQLHTTPSEPKISLPRTVVLELDEEAARNARASSAQEPQQTSTSGGTSKRARPSAVFRAVGRDRGGPRESPPEVGHYDPQLSAVSRRAPSALIVDRHLLATKPRRDERGPLDPEKPRTHVPALSFQSYPGRATIITGRNVSTLTAAEQRAFYSVRDSGPDGPYEVDRYWNGPGKHHAPAATLAGVGRDAPLATDPDSAPRVYPGGPAFHVAWTAPQRGCAVNMSAMRGRDARRPVWTVRHVVPVASSTDFAGLSPVGDSDGAAARAGRPRGGAGSFDRMLPRDRTAAAIRAAPSPSQRLAYASSDSAVRPAPAGLVAFDKLVSRPPLEAMQAEGRHSPDVFYDAVKPGRAGSQPPTPDFNRMLGRAASAGAPPSPSAYLTYYDARPPAAHTPTVDISRSIGHTTFGDPCKGGRGQSLPRSLSPPGARAATAPTSPGSAGELHPLDNPKLGRHVREIDLKAGGTKPRGPPLEHMVDKTYDTAPGYRLTSRRVRSPAIGEGGGGRRAGEAREQRRLIEGTVRQMLQHRLRPATGDVGAASPAPAQAAGSAMHGALGGVG